MEDSEVPETRPRGAYNLEDFLSGLGTVDVPSARVDENVNVAREDFILELSDDGINSERFDYHPDRFISHVPQPALTTCQSEPANVCHVPICQPAVSSIFPADIPITKNPLPPSLWKKIDLDEIRATDSPILGLLTRVAQAILCLETGATPARAPNRDSWDVRVDSNGSSFDSIHDFPGHTPVFIPGDMDRLAAQALISLCLPGGASAYGWRFRPIDGVADAREALMPSYARKLYPGGDDRILVLVERDTAETGWTFGGDALTLDAFAILEGWLRRKFGNGLMDAAFKTAAALGHVYVNPKVTDAKLGAQFDVVQATREYDGLDLGGPVCAWGSGARHPSATAIYVIKLGTHCHDQNMPLIIAIKALQVMCKTVGAVVPDDVPSPPALNRSSEEVKLSWYIGRKQTGSCTAKMRDVLVWFRDNINGMDRECRGFVKQWMIDMGGLAMGYDDSERDSSNVRLEGFRNSYGYDDDAEFVLPDFDLRAVTGTLAGAYIPEVRVSIESGLTRENRRDRLRQYISKMHVAQVFSMAGANIWPGMLDGRDFDHLELVVKLPKGLQPMTFLENGDRSKLSAPNWQILEPVLRLKGTKDTTAYYGYNVPGTWDAHSGVINLEKTITSIPALDAALRSTWMWSGKVDVDSPMLSNFAVVRDLNGFYQPLGFAPIVQSKLWFRGVSIASNGRNAAALGAGRNHSIDSVMAR